MGVSLGPLPPHLRAVVAAWIDEGRATEPTSVDDSINARYLVGGPGGCSYLDADGEVWDRFLDDDGFTRAEDGPRKVSIIGYAATRLPALAAWLPARPPEARPCPVCGGTGQGPPQHPQLAQCWECVGLGWIA